MFVLPVILSTPASKKLLIPVAELIALTSVLVQRKRALNTPVTCAQTLSNRCLSYPWVAIVLFELKDNIDFVGEGDSILQIHARICCTFCKVLSCRGMIGHQCPLNVGSLC